MASGKTRPKGQAAPDPVEPVEVVAPSVADIERLHLEREQKLEQEQALAAQKAAEEAQLEQELQVEDDIARFKRETPEFLDCYRVKPDQPRNVVLRGQCFQPGDLFRAAPMEIPDHQLAICTKV